MDLLERLKGPELVAKFQQVCGIERLTDIQTDTDDQDPDLFECNESYNKYVKHRHSHKYVLQEKYKKNNNVVKKNSLAKEVVPPFTSDDSDSDISNTEGQGHYKITPHRINNNLLYYAFKIASFFGDEEFYLTFFPFVVWNIDMYLVRHTAYVWAAAMFWGQVTKDIFQWPRPCVSKVVRLDVDFAQEYAMPSTHAVAGSSIPLVLGYTMVNRYQIPTPLVIAVAIFWCIMVCCSRLYLGVHSVLDLIVGCAFSLLSAAVILPVIEQLDWFVQTNPVSPVLLFLLCLLFSTVFYPAPEIGNNTRGDSVQVIATVTGFLIGTWCNYYNGMSYVVTREGLYTIYMPSLKMFATAALRFIIGGITLILVKTAVKTVSVKGASYMLGLNKPDRHHLKVQIWYKFITYMTLGVIMTWTVPILHGKFGLGRPGLYTEVV